MSLQIQNKNLNVCRFIRLLYTQNRGRNLQMIYLSLPHNLTSVPSMARD